MSLVSSLFDRLPSRNKRIEQEVQAVRRSLEDLKNEEKLALQRIRASVDGLHNQIRQELVPGISEVREEESLTRQRIQANVDGVYERTTQLIDQLVEMRSQSAQSAVRMESAAIAYAPRFYIEHLDVHIVDHCNLNCKTCSVYSPLANEWYASVDSIDRDLCALRNLIDEGVLRLHIMGGEPLLHPDLELIIVKARQYFPASDIDITTNGLLVFKMADSLWQTMKDYDIALKYTRYPVPFSYDQMKSYVREKGVSIYSAGENAVDVFRKIPLNPDGIYSSTGSYSQCPYAECVQLRDGKLFRCPISAYSFLLNAKITSATLTEAFKLSKMDYVALGEKMDREELLLFISRAIPFCRYCGMNRIDPHQPWAQSNCDVREWLDSRWSEL